VKYRNALGQADYAVACNSTFVHRPLLLCCSYTQNGLLGMLDRNRRIKPKPERFQECNEHFDVIITCEERVYDQVIEGNHNVYFTIYIMARYWPCAVFN